MYFNYFTTLQGIRVSRDTGVKGYNGVKDYWCQGIVVSRGMGVNGTAPLGGLTRGLVTLPQGNQKPLMVKDKVWRPAGRHGVCKSIEHDV